MPSPHVALGQKGAFLTNLSPSMEYLLCLEFGFGFPYLYDETQTITQSYGAICTPDFFGYNANHELQYRGRFDDRGSKKNNNPNQSDLFKAMFLITRTKKGPELQSPSVGCSIKWRK